MAQPQVISSQSPLAAKIWLPRPDWLSAATAIATTPSPNAISTKVPRNSADSSPHTVCRQRPRAPSAPAARADILVTPFRARAPPSALLATVTSWDAWDGRAVPAPAAPSRRGAGDGAARPCRRPLRRRTRRQLPCPFPHHAVGHAHFASQSESYPAAGVVETADQVKPTDPRFHVEPCPGPAARTGCGRARRRGRRRP